MSTRINKLLGYGLKDVKSKKFNIIDPRFNLEDGYFAFDSEKQENKFTFKKFIQHLKNKIEQDEKPSMLSFEVYDYKKNKDKNIYELVHFDPEFGLPNVVLFQTTSKDWSRYDDIIDYIDAKNCKPKVTTINRPIYPYESWTNLKTGLNYLEIDGKRLQLVEFLQAINWMIKHKQPCNLEYLNEFGFDSIEDAKTNIVPMVPEIIKELCIYLKVFKDESTILQLKPMIYTYWA